MSPPFPQHKYPLLLLSNHFLPPPKSPAQHFCKALVSFLFDRLLDRRSPGDGGLLASIRAAASADAASGDSAAERTAAVTAAVTAVTASTPSSPPAAPPLSVLVSELTSVLRALDLLLEGDPRLLGLLAVPAALAPIAACLQPAAELTGEEGVGEERGESVRESGAELCQQVTPQTWEEKVWEMREGGSKGEKWGWGLFACQMRKRYAGMGSRGAGEWGAPPCLLPLPTLSLPPR